MSNVRVVKKKAYPFSALITKAPGTPVIRGQILKLTELGFLVQVGQDSFFKVGNNHTVEFDVPSTHVTVQAEIKVMKTYDVMNEIADKQVEKVYTVEMHFRGLNDKAKEAIQFFIKKIGQK